MKNRKTRSTLSRPLKSKPNKSNKKVLIAIILLLILIVIGYLVSARSLPNDVMPTKSTPSTAEKTEAAQPASIPVEDASDDSGNINDSVGTDAETPEPDAILNAPLPETDSLAKEEIDRLEDERLRLAEQERLAAEQVAMNKKLTDMKAEQIELLEQQIAQLEADVSGTLAKNTAK